MASESILTYKKPGFPKTTDTANGLVTRIEYVGPTATLEGARPAYGAAWGDYLGTVSSTDLHPAEVAGTVTLSVDVQESPNLSDSTTGTAKEVTYEIEWVPVSRSMFEHKQFRLGGGGANALIKQDIIDIEFWKNEIDPTLKSDFKYDGGRADGVPDETELTANAKLYATGILTGVEEYDDFAPIARKTTAFVGGPPATSSAGTKQTLTTFPGLPTGYEWLKTADRAIRAGGQRRWEKVEEWTGAIKVLVDRDQVYWTTPA